MSFIYSKEAHAELTKLLTTDRMTSYLIETRGDVGLAIRLYEKNTRLSEAMYGVLQGCEMHFEILFTSTSLLLSANKIGTITSNLTIERI